MENKKHPSKPNEMKNFVSGPAFQKAVRKSKLNQILLLILISILTIFVFLFIIQYGSNMLINKKINQEVASLTEQIHASPNKGAGIVDFDTSFSYGFLSAEGKITYYKKLGDRMIPWEIVTKEYPAIGKTKKTNAHTVEVVYTSNQERTVRYNDLNNERKIDFYYPQIGYHVLPQELEIATTLDENTLVEVALSFKNSITVEEVGKAIGAKNVDWLWLDKSNADYFNELHDSEADYFHVLYGEDAYGFSVSEDNPYWEQEYFKNSKNEYPISGAIISGTPSELERFLEIDLIRASVIGLTIDKY
ncbi:anti sigma factor C-terminal domain-containing protein [Paucisalibacillus sp. EB02]|uniref:anti sigma factor C-terminal domain-containing protein n=1 Tax=Paucisalibacillus sp. EB02 TaxID=1347087 RepID=UPI0004B82B70|nr:anti sigma factor C-terminal domain-containing protein [Paucisalibacillus sp. EB02]